MGNQTRMKLIEVATELFAVKGFAAVSVRELTETAQVNVSAISYHFSGKEGLYEAVLLEQLSPILEILRGVEKTDSSSPVTRLTFYADRVAHIHAQRPFLSRFIYSEATNPTEYGRPIIEKHLLQVYQFINSTLQEGIAKGYFRDDLNVIHAAVALVGILNFYFIAKPLVFELFPFIKQENSENEYVAQAFRIYLHGVMKETAVQKPE